MRGAAALGGLMAAAVLAGCVSAPVHPPEVLVQPEITLPPAPPRALTVGVYSCIDTSGQRRPTRLPQELSTAVPMDCTPYLIDAVRSVPKGYVFLVERQHVDELLRERQLATLALNTPTDAAPAAGIEALPPPPARRLITLRVAEILLIGQVVAYDRATRQVAGGVAVNSTGGSGEYVTDLVTFSLRAVAVQTGEVLGQSTVSKSVTSLSIGGHISKIYSTDVVEIEFGGAGNEPVGLALGAAVRSALIALINQGLRDGWWS
jgi:curli production assembly/transport component CsgG